MPKTLYINNFPVTQDKKFTYLAAAANATDNTISVVSTIGFHSLTTSSGQILCIGEIGAERSEIIRTSQNTALSGQTVTLRQQLRFDHGPDKKVYIIDYDRIEPNSATTITGAKSTLVAYPIAIQADQKETLFYDTTLASGFYFFRYNNTIESVNSDWSDAVPFVGFGDNTVLKIKERALNAVGAEIDEIITHAFLNEKLWEARREYHNSPGKRPFRRKFNEDIGNVATGIYRIALPPNVQKPFTADNVYGVRIGTKENMKYIDKKTWDDFWVGIAHSTITVDYATNSRDLYLANARDFRSSGVVSLEQTNVEYSARSISGGTLRISVQGSYAVSAGADVWQDVTYGLPDRFTVFGDVAGSAFIYFNRPIDTAYVDQNIWSDYYQTLPTYDSDADELDEPEFDMYVRWLSWCIKKRKDSSLKAEEDDDFREWQRKKQESLAKEQLSTDIYISPNIDHLPLPL